MHHLDLRRLVGAGLALILVLGWAPRAMADDAKPPAAKPPAAKPPAAKAPAAKTPATPPAPATAKAPEAPAEPTIRRPFAFPEPEILEAEDGTVTYFYRTNFVKPTDLEKSLKLVGVGGGRKAKVAVPVDLKPFAAQNQLLIQGDHDLVLAALEVIRYFDVAAPQVLIEAKVIEITYDSNFEFGMEWTWDRSAVGPANTLFRGSEGVLNPPSLLRSNFPPGFPFQGTSLVWGLRGDNADKFGAFDVAFQTLLINGKAEVLSKPSIIATQGVQAKVTTEENIPIAQFDNADVNNTRFRGGTIKSGVSLIVNPSHVGESFVTLKINPSVRGVQNIAASRLSGTFAPITTSRSADTTVTLGDGETLVIGGLFTNSSVKERAKTPIFSDLPLVGDLFTRTRETKQKTELVFILTPHILRKTGAPKLILPPSEYDRLDRQDPETGGEKCKVPKIFRKPGAYLDDFEEDESVPWPLR